VHHATRLTKEVRAILPAAVALVATHRDLPGRLVSPSILFRLSQSLSSSDPATAEFLCRRAADRDSPDALYALATSFSLPADASRAFLGRAAALDHPPALWDIFISDVSTNLPLLFPPEQPPPIVLKLSAAGAISRARALFQANPPAALLCYRVYARTRPHDLAFYRDLLVAGADPALPGRFFALAETLLERSPDVAYELYRDGMLASPAFNAETGAAADGLIMLVLNIENALTDRVAKGREIRFLMNDSAFPSFAGDASLLEADDSPPPPAPDDRPRILREAIAGQNCREPDLKIALDYLRELSQTDKEASFLYGLVLAAGCWGVPQDLDAAEALWADTGVTEYKGRFAIGQPDMRQAQAVFLRTKIRQADNDDDRTFWMGALAERIKECDQANQLWKILWTEISRHPRAARKQQWERVFRYP
jgi:TPR repeat protein